VEQDVDDICHPSGQFSPEDTDLAYKITPRLLYPGREARAALGCGLTKYYELINSGQLDARQFGKRTYITAESLMKLVESLKPVVTPTMAKAKHNRLPAQGGLLPKPETPGDETGTPKKWAHLRKGRQKTPEDAASAPG
jgi:hypothetical protein